MPSTQSFQPDWASAPGDTIADVLKERGLSSTEFAERMGQTLDGIQDLLHGRTAITIAIARRLELVLGASVEFWMARDFQYRESVARYHATDHAWLSELPVADMIRFGWVTPPKPSDEVAACLSFFGVPTVRAWREAHASLLERSAFRTSPTLDSRPGAVAAWLRQGEIEAQAIKCAGWDASGFRELLTHLRCLTREKHPSRFVPKLQDYCAAKGVAVATVRAPAGCRASGATRFLSESKALLLLSFRFLTDDHFWFTFFHEAGHLLLHGKTRLFLEDLETPSSVEEQEANAFAASVLVPPEFQASMRTVRLNAREVIRFSRHLGVSPGITVGQLQHVGRLKRNQLNTLKRRYQWEGNRPVSREIL